jgi:hypothetical protein
MTPAAASAREDLVTVAAVAVLAACATTFAHEALGHGGACLLGGGQVTQLTSVYFQCEPHSAWVAAAGPGGNLLAALVAGLAARSLPAGFPRLRLLLVLVSAFSLFWEAGYLLYAMALREGDWAVAAEAAFGAASARWRLGGVLLGVGLYGLGLGVTKAALKPFGPRAGALMRSSWIAAFLATTFAAAAYAPERLGAMGQAALEVGAASLPLLLLRRRATPAVAASEAAVASGPLWIGLAAVAYALFVATLGRGLP